MISGSHGPLISMFFETEQKEHQHRNSRGTPESHIKLPTKPCSGITNASANWRARNRTNYRDPVLKFVYLTCATLITTTFIIECILLHLVIMPYCHESGFTPTECAYKQAHVVMNAVKCENKCSKDRSSFRCIRVVVSYTKWGRNYTANLFDNIATYQHYHNLGCATSSCHRQNAANHAWVQRFHRMIRRSMKFTCFTHEDHINEALLHKFYGPATLFNTLFWPLGLFGLSTTCLLILWLYDRCRVWGDGNIVIA
ncbi:Calcium activated potassium channel subunit [Fasciola hepatica]|uniref:Calcium activated potassium channel subunit n=1 Tax=Fasciola hepatica TaxID=6192 RepID=A0A4E0RRI8_FASHE|nr:Calcium activated potassium channel subunit [Fasciola hepatica]